MLFLVCFSTLVLGADSSENARQIVCPANGFTEGQAGTITCTTKTAAYDEVCTSTPTGMAFMAGTDELCTFASFTCTTPSGTPKGKCLSLTPCTCTCVAGTTGRVEWAWNLAPSADMHQLTYSCGPTGCDINSNKTAADLPSLNATHCSQVAVRPRTTALAEPRTTALAEPRTTAKAADENVTLDTADENATKAKEDTNDTHGEEETTKHPPSEFARKRHIFFVRLFYTVAFLLVSFLVFILCLFIRDYRRRLNLTYMSGEEIPLREPQYGDKTDDSPAAVAKGSTDKLNMADKLFREEQEKKIKEKKEKKKKKETDKAKSKGKTDDSGSDSGSSGSKKSASKDKPKKDEEKAKKEEDKPKKKPAKEEKSDSDSD